MKTKIFGLCPGKIILAAFLFTILVQAADAQTLTLQLSSQARRVINHLVSFDSHYGTYLGPLFTSLTNGTGAFNVSDTESTPVGDYYVAVANTALQDSTITATATSLSVTGHVEISCSGSATSSQAGSGSAIWDGNVSEVVVGFVIDQPFTYSLQATTTLNTNLTETLPIAMIGLSNEGDSSTALPNIVAYGSVMDLGGTAHIAPSASGTNAGVFSAGTYYFVARVHSASKVEPSFSPTAEHFLAAFNFTVTYVPPQPPVIMAFTPNGAGSFTLIWNAPQAGNYRVLSSTNLTVWSEWIPASAQPSGLNTNVVSAISDSNRGFFRVEYLP